MEAQEKKEPSQEKLQEKSQEKEPQGWMSRWERAGVIVGCLAGVFGAVGAGAALWQQFVVIPHVQLVFLGDNIEAHWDTQARRLSFDCWIVASNDGRADDTLRAVAASLLTAKGEALRFPQIVIKERGDGVPRPLFHLDPNKQLDVLVTVTSVLDPKGEQSFRELGLYKLVLDFDAPVSRLKRRMTHCFWFREQASGDLTANGSLALVREDSCEELQGGSGGRTASN